MERKVFKQVLYIKIMNKSIKILLTSSFFITLAGGFFTPIYAIFVEEIGGDILTAGSAYAAFAIVSGLLIYLISMWEDRVKHQEKLLITGRILGVIGFAGYLAINNPIDLFIVQIILGISSAIGSPAFDSSYSKSLDKGKFASEWGLWESMAGIVTGVGAFVGSFIAMKFGFYTLFYIMFISSVCSLIATCFLLSIEKKNKKKTKKKRSSKV